MAAFAPMVGKHLGVKKVPIKYSINGKARSVEIPDIMHLAVEPLPSAHPSGETWAAAGHPVAPDKLALGVGGQGQLVCRSRHALGQFGQERPLRADQLVELTAAPASRRLMPGEGRVRLGG